MSDDWRARVVACVHEDSRDERKAQRYRAMIRDWAEEMVRNARPAGLPLRDYVKRQRPSWTDDEIEHHMRLYDFKGPVDVERRGEEGEVILYDPIGITTHAGTPLNKKYATLAAIHDASQHCDFPIDPWAGKQWPRVDQSSTDDLHELNLGIKYELLKSLVPDLTDDDRLGIQRMLDDVAADLEHHVGDGVQRMYPRWLVTAGRRLEEAADKNPTVRDHFRGVCHAAMEAHRKGVELLPLPPPTLPEKYALLCAIHDLTCPHYEPFNPWWGPWHLSSSPNETLTKGMVYLEDTWAAVDGLKDDDRQDVEVILNEVLDDLADKGLVGGPAPDQKPLPAPDNDVQKSAARPDRHSPDFHSVHWFGTGYTFTHMQAAVVKELWAAWEQGTPDVGDPYLLTKADSDGDRLSDLFKGHPAWGTMIIEGATRGTRRLSNAAKS